MPAAESVMEVSADQLLSAFLLDKIPALVEDVGENLTLGEDDWSTLMEHGETLLNQLQADFEARCKEILGRK